MDGQTKWTRSLLSPNLDKTLTDGRAKVLTSTAIVDHKKLDWSGWSVELDPRWPPGAEPEMIQRQNCNSASLSGTHAMPGSIFYRPFTTFTASGKIDENEDCVATKSVIAGQKNFDEDEEGRARILISLRILLEEPQHLRRSGCTFSRPFTWFYVKLNMLRRAVQRRYSLERVCERSGTAARGSDRNTILWWSIIKIKSGWYLNAVL